MFLVDDSASMRKVLGATLRSEGYEVEEFPDAASAIARATNPPTPSVVVTDLMMPGISGVQLCRLLQADAATAGVPVVLLTASSDRRSRFWARIAGAAAYVTKTEANTLVQVLPTVLRSDDALPSTRVVVATRATVEARLSQLLDSALFDSVVAGEVRSISGRGDSRELFTAFAAVVADVIGYRWLALLTKSGPLLSLHTTATQAEQAEREARLALGVSPESVAFVLTDDRAVNGTGPAPLLAPVMFAGEKLADLAFGFAGRGIGPEDKKLAMLLAQELTGPLRMNALVEDTRRLASTDALTGLLNRRAFLDAAERERSRADRHVLPVSLLLLDVDHFKAVNDTYGHAAGDEVLRNVSKVLLGVARRSDIVARWGGEEFVVLLPQTSEAGARVAAERIRQAIAAMTHKLPSGKSINVTASIGVAGADAPWGLDTIIVRADSAMYAAKGRGRNRVEVARQ